MPKWRKGKRKLPERGGIGIPAASYHFLDDHPDMSWEEYVRIQQELITVLDDMLKEEDTGDA